jgi:molecular chaperone GrpE
VSGEPNITDEQQEEPRVAAPPGAGDDAAPEEELRAEDAAVEAPDEPDWHDLALRKAAELENLRKQSAQRIQKATRDGMRRVAVELLPALDDFERALQSAEAQEGDAEHHLTAGIRLVQQQLVAALKRAGIETYSPKGETFDPHLHEAVATAPVEGADSGTVIEVYQAGYRLGEDVLRAAKVVVAA